MPDAVCSGLTDPNSVFQPRLQFKANVFTHSPTEASRIRHDLPYQPGLFVVWSIGHQYHRLRDEWQSTNTCELRREIGVKIINLWKRCQPRQQTSDQRETRYLRGARPHLQVAEPCH